MDEEIIFHESDQIADESDRETNLKIMGCRDSAHTFAARELDDVLLSVDNGQLSVCTPLATTKPIHKSISAKGHAREGANAICGCAFMC